MFKRILIANRGEIACRVIKTARRMGIRDGRRLFRGRRDALHVEMADEADPHRSAAGRRKLSGRSTRSSPPARPAGAEAVHPGYGFLSESEAFAEALAEAGIVFIGPNPKAIEAMGDKIESKKAAAARQGLDRARPPRRHRG